MDKRIRTLKRIIIILLLWMGVAYADSLLKNLTENTSPLSTDIAYLTCDPGGTPVDRKVTLANLITKAHGLTGSGYVLNLNGSNVIQVSAFYDRIVGVFDGGGAAIATGKKIYLRVPFNCTITEWSIMTDNAGSIITIDVWAKAWATDSLPTNAESITALDTPYVGGTYNATGSTLSGWTTSLTAGQMIAFATEGSPSGATWAMIQLKVRR